MTEPLVMPALDWDKQGGLVPAVVQDAASHRVLMLGYMSPKSLERTLSTGLATFHSRSRQRLWTKGETSGHTQEIVELRLDCDQDAVLMKVRQIGPACHTNRLSCFYRKVERAADGSLTLAFSTPSGGCGHDH